MPERVFFGFSEVPAVSASAMRMSAAVMNSPHQYAHLTVGSGCDAKNMIKKMGPTMPKTNIIAWITKYRLNVSISGAQYRGCQMSTARR